MGTTSDSIPETSEHAVNAPAGSFRELWIVGFPLIISSGSLMLMHVCDRMFLTWYSTDALAASLPASLLFWTAISLPTGIVLYVNTFIAQYEGANQPSRVAASLWQGVYLSLFFSLFLIILAPFSIPLFDLIGHADKVQQLESSYFVIMCLGAPAFLLTNASSCLFSGRGQTSVVMWIDFGSVCVNVVLDYVMIFGWGPFPRLGMNGAAMATVTAKVIAVISYLVWIRTRSQLNAYKIWANRGWNSELFLRLLKYGVPNGVQMLIDALGFTLFLLFLGRLGTTELAATNLAFNLNAFAFVPLIGMGTAVSTLVGHRIGEQRPQLAVRTTWIAFWLCAGYLSILILFYLFAPEFAISFYSIGKSAEEFAPLQKLVVLLVRFISIYCLFDALAIIFGSAIRGAGDTRFSLLFTAGCCWLLMVIPTYLGLKYNLPAKVGMSELFFCWTTCTIYLLTLGIGMFIRFQNGKWKSMTVLENNSESLSVSEESVAQESVGQESVAQEHSVSCENLFEQI